MMSAVLWLFGAVFAVPVAVAIAAAVGVREAHFDR
jgi:hypothetical protein